MNISELPPRVKVKAPWQLEAERGFQGEAYLFECANRHERLKHHECPPGEGPCEAVNVKIWGKGNGALKADGATIWCTGCGMRASGDSAQEAAVKWNAMQEEAHAARTKLLMGVSP